MFRAAFYRGTRPGLQGLYNRLVRAWTRGAYSHAELQFADGLAASASFLDGGVRFKQIEFDAARWDFVVLPAGLEPQARAWFAAHVGAPYDTLGLAGFILRPILGQRRAWFCSEAIAAALGIDAPWRWEPNALAAACRWAGGVPGK